MTPGYAHAAPPPAHIRNMIRSRWLTWFPAALISTRRGTAREVPERVEALRCRHESLCQRAHAAGLPWTTINMHALDDPLADDAELDQRLREAIARRTARMGRLKGKRRSHAHQP